MKKWIALLTALMMLLAAVPSVAEGSVNPLGMLFDAERELLLHTPNVTMTAQAVFKIGDVTFKTASLAQLQDGVNSKRDWILKTPRDNGEERETGYTVVSIPGQIIGMESARKDGWKYHFYAGPDTQKSTILYHTVGLSVIMKLAETVANQLGEQWMERCRAEKLDEGWKITLAVEEKDVPELLNAALNVVTQYTANRYKSYSYAELPYGQTQDYSDFETVTEGLLVCMDHLSLNGLKLEGTLDHYGRLTELEGTITVQLTQKNGSRYNLSADFVQCAGDYGLTQLPEDATVDNRWAAADSEAEWVDLEFGNDPEVRQMQPAEALDYARNAVTEIYGYTPDEADEFVFADNDGGKILFYPKGHPEWTYELNYKDGMNELKTPFATSYENYPG